jgi:hypothetical protein
LVTSEVLLLASTAASIAFIHTLLGPDHYLPFIVMGRARQWSKAKVAWITTLCGLGHVAGSILIGAIGIAAGVAVGELEVLEGFRGSLASWAVFGFGLAYMVWGLRRAMTGKSHTHAHIHPDGTTHSHGHDHRGGHVHVHEAPAQPRASLTPWVLFTIFVLGPCEPLIPLLMVPAVEHGWHNVALISGIFGVVTIATMLGVVFAGISGLSFVSIKSAERFAHALAGAVVAICGGAMVFLGA